MRMILEIALGIILAVVLWIVALYVILFIVEYWVGILSTIAVIVVAIFLYAGYINGDITGEGLSIAAGIPLMIAVIAGLFWIYEWIVDKLTRKKSA